MGRRASEDNYCSLIRTMIGSEPIVSTNHKSSENEQINY